MRNKIFLTGILLSIPLSFILIWLASRHIYWSDNNWQQRIWLHRTNSPEKMKEFAGEYNGFECDVLLRSDSLIDVTHDEPVSYGISAESFFPLLQHNTRNLWFDFKNLNSDNAVAALNLFEKWCDRYDIDKRRLILEGSDTYALSLFHDHGFYTAYYVRMEEGRNLNDILKSGAVDALSFHASDYNRIASTVTESSDWLVWEHRHSREVLPFLPRGRKLLHDTRVKIILVKDKGHHHL